MKTQNFPSLFNLKKTYHYPSVKKFPIENVRIFLKKRRRSETGNADPGQGNAEKSGRSCESGGFDSQQYYACRHIYYFMKNAVLQKKTAVYSGYRQLLLEIKESCRQILKEAAGKDAPVFCAITLGDKQELDPETQMALSAGRDHTYPCHQRTSYQYSGNGALTTF